LGYDLIKDITRDEFHYKQTEDEEADWDLIWCDLYITPNLLLKMKPYQRANHYPGTFNLAHKNCLGKNLMGLGKYFPNEYDFFPRTWILPQEI
jgi:tubulin polyglutamylase TTLL6/13